MIYYCAVALWPLLVMLVNYALEKKVGIYKDKEKYSAFLCVLPMALLYALRYRRIGADTPGYVSSFLNIRNYTFSELFENEFRHEKGFLLYEKIISLFTDNYTVYFLITSIILFGILGRFAYKYSGNVCVFLFLFVSLGTYQFYLTGLRQALAMSICMLAFDYVKNKKVCKFILYVIFASLFHRSAIIFLIVYPLCNLKKISSTIMSYGITTVGLLISFTSFNDFVNDLLGYEYGVEQTGNGQIFLILLSIFMLYSLYNVPKIKKRGINTVPIMHLSFITIMLWVLRLVSRVAERPSYYFICGLYAFIGLSFKYGRAKENFVINLGIVCISFALFVYRNLGTSTYLFYWAA